MTVRTRVSALATVAAAASLLTAPIAASASEPTGRSSDVMNRGDRRGQTPPEGPGEEGQTGEEVDDCPTELWTIPLEIKGLACVLVLGKPADDESTQ